MIKKINKHKQILKKRFNNNSEEEKLKSINNEYLTRIYSVIQDAKNQIYSQQDLENFKSCENYRSRLLENDTVITYEIFGLDDKVKVKDICSRAASSINWCRLIYSLINKLSINTVFEIGTNLGISGSYTMHALKTNPNSNFVTLEGLKKLCEISGNEFSSINPNQKFKIWEGLYDDTFDNAISSIEHIDYAFIDGNHHYEPTIEYFEKLEPLIKEKGVLLFDDINWSDGMKKAWEEIKKSNKVNFTLDLYEIGIAVIDRTYKGSKNSFDFHYSY